MSDRRWDRVLLLALVMSIAANVVLLVKPHFPSWYDAWLLALQESPRLVPGDHVAGQAAIPSMVIMYSDFQCPFCASSYASLRSLTQQGRIRLVYRHFPLDGHPLALPAAEASECAAEQERFWEYADVLFGQGERLRQENFAQIAKSLGLEAARFESCLLSGRGKRNVETHLADALGRRMTGTPVLYVNGERFNGALPKERLAQLLEARR